MSDHYCDDFEEVPPGTTLIRRIRSLGCAWADMNAVGQPRITREAVQFYREREAIDLGFPGPAMSFFDEAKLLSIGDLFERYPENGFARINVDVIRSRRMLGAQARPTDDNPEHIVVFRLDGGKRIQKGEATRIAEELTDNWMRIPPVRLAYT